MNSFSLEIECIPVRHPKGHFADGISLAISSDDRVITFDFIPSDFGYSHETDSLIAYTDYGIEVIFDTLPRGWVITTTEVYIGVEPEDLEKIKEMICSLCP